jgi:hypothetical protein
LTLQEIMIPADGYRVNHPNIKERRESRFKPNQTATLKVLGKAIGAIPGPTIAANILDCSGSGMRLRSKLPVPCGAEIEIDANSTVVLGNVLRCEPEKKGYELGIQVSQITAASEVV